MTDRLGEGPLILVGKFVQRCMMADAYDPFRNRTGKKIFLKKGKHHSSLVENTDIFVFIIV